MEIYIIEGAKVLILKHYEALYNLFIDLFIC